MLVRARLRDVAVTTFTTPAARLAPHLPAGVEPCTVPTRDGERALVSAVSFRLGDVRVGRAPIPVAGAGHVDYRAYVRHDGGTAVWFLAAAMASPVATLLRRVWAMPWHRARVDLAATPAAYSVHVSDGIATLDLVARRPRGAEPADPADQADPANGTDGTDGNHERPLDGFGSSAESAALLLNPTVGLFAGRDGVRRYDVAHAPLEGQPLDPVAARVELFERLGLTTAGSRPHSVLALPDFAIDIRMPPWPAVLTGPRNEDG